MGNGEFPAVWTSRERMLSSAMAPNPSEKSRAVALALCIPLGVFGAHRFYVGKIGTGLLMLCTLGGLGLWYLYDLITIASGERSEEHTSELQSQSNLVCRLLLEKKKKK